MKIREIITIIEDFAPLTYQESYDNSGLNIGRSDATCTGYLICFDVTEAVLEEAMQKNCNLILSHHPVTLDGLTHFRGETRAERVIETALKNGIALYACHTPLDSTRNGINAYLGQQFGLKTPRSLQPIEPAMGPEIGIGVVGRLSAPCTIDEWIERLQNQLHPTLIRCSRLDPAAKAKQIHRVAFCGGSGGRLISAAAQAKADVYVSGDLKYHDFTESHNGMILMDLGHFETEHFGIEILHDVLRKKIPTFAGSISENVINPIHYIV